MNKKSWLIVGLSLAMAATLGVGLSACGGETHTHNYDTWDYNATQHWKYCDEHGTDKSNIDETTKANHDFKDGKCECGATEGQEIPDADLDTREFWVTGTGAGDLANASWTELKPNFKLTKQPHKDADGFTLYTIQMKIFAGGDKFKIRQDERDENNALKWTKGTFFGLTEIKNNDGTFIDMGNEGDIGVAKGKDGIYKFTVHTKPAPAPWADNYVSWELIESVAAPTTTEDMYIVGTIKTQKNSQWPDFTDVKKNCIHMTFDGTDTWYADVELTIGDQFKVYNILNKQYYPNVANLTTGETWLYRVSWKVGQDDVKVEHLHKYTMQGYDGENHWMKCPKDDVRDESTVEAHDFTSGDTCKCGFQKEADPDWKINEDGTLNEYTGDYVNLKIPANLEVFPDYGKLFGMGENNKYEFAMCEQKNLAKVQSVTVDPKNEHFKVENNTVLSKDGTVLYMYFPYSTETSVTFENVTEIANSAFIFNATVTTINFPKVVTIGRLAFYNTKLESATLPMIETISEEAFYQSTVKTIDLSSAKTIGNNAFCKSAIETLDLENIEKLGTGAFSNCKQLTEVVIGANIKELPTSAGVFGFCSLLKTVTVKAVTPPATAALFPQCPLLTDIYVPAESVDAYKALAKWSLYADKIKAIPAEAASAQEVALPASKKED